MPEEKWEGPPLSPGEQEIIDRLAVIETQLTTWGRMLLRLTHDLERAAGKPLREKAD